MGQNRRDRTITIVLLSACALILLVWDVNVAFNEGKNDTISEFLRDVSTNVWVLPFLLMGVMGHLFWNRREGEDRNFRPEILLGSALFVVCIDLTRWATGLTYPHNSDVLVGLIGFVVGAAFWPQGPKWEPAEDKVDSEKENDHA